MIAVVTSTIKPETENGIKRSYYTFAERLEQTKLTLTRLEECGFTLCFLIDNSPTLNQYELKQLFHNFSKVKFYHLQQFQFNNKGINELMMMLFIIEHLPLNQPIFKISGRYYPTSAFEKPVFSDFAVKGYHFNKRTGTISTRGYWAKDSKVLQALLLSCLKEIFVYPERITGIRSLFLKLGKVIFNKQFVPVNISIEFAVANTLKTGNYQIQFLNHIGIEGLIAGSDHLEKICE